MLKNMRYSTTLQKTGHAENSPAQQNHLKIPFVDRVTLCPSSSPGCWPERCFFNFSTKLTFLQLVSPEQLTMEEQNVNNFRLQSTVCREKRNVNGVNFSGNFHEKPLIAITCARLVA